jgi:hypothetical protein
MTTIKNTAPATVVVTEVVAGYTSACLATNIGIDSDIAGRVVNVDNSYNSQYSGDAPYTLVPGFSQNTTYAVKMGRFDSMNNNALVQAGFNINFSPEESVSMRTYPSISSYSIKGEFVEVGSSPPILNLTLAGDADSIQIEYSEVGANSWKSGWSGPFSNDLLAPGLPVGTWDFRVRGIINLPVTPFIQYSGWVGLNNIQLLNQFIGPSTPTGLSFTIGKLAEPTERYDAEVTWNWSRGTGPQIRFFVLERLDITRYGANWNNAEQINTGSSTSYTIVNHPRDKQFRYRVSAVSWGPEPTNRATTNALNLTINDQTTTVNLVRDSKIEMNYAHIKAYVDINGVSTQTFLLDASTGGMSIGKLDGQGNAPITVDGISGNLSVSGSIITDSIFAANFVLANTNGASNPSLYSAAKTSYGDGSEGIFMGHDSSNNFKFALGNAAEYIKWDGSNLRISGDVLVGSSGTTKLDTAFDVTLTPTTAFKIVTSLSGIPSTDASKSAHYKDKIGADPITSSVLVYVKNNTVNGGFTKYYTYSGSSWSAINLVVDGNLLATGTVTADAIAANTITGNQITSNLDLKVGTGNLSSTISATDSSYRFWVGHDSSGSAPFRVTKAGSLELNSGATSSALILKNNAIIIRDSSGAIRVQIGDLSVT